MVVRFPRYLQAEVNTHRKFSRSSGSSRAVPVKKLYKMIEESPWVPLMGYDQPGMSTALRLSGEQQAACEVAWCRAANECLKICGELGLIVHKQWANRLIEPWMYQSVIITSTEWANFFYQRVDRGAQPEMQVLAMRMYMAYLASTPEEKSWHTPFLTPAEEHRLPWKWDAWDDELPDLIKMAIARCARVSYYNHEGTREDAKDIALFDKLTSQGSYSPGHWAPLEHCAIPIMDGELCADNFEGWTSIRRWYHTRYRKGVPTMADVAEAIKQRFPQGFEVLGQRIFLDREEPVG
jgi:hypothetical protein